MYANSLISRVARDGMLPMILFASLFMRGSEARADDDLRKILGKIAQHVGDILKHENRDSLAIQFRGPPTFPSNASPLIIQILTEELALQQITVKKVAPIALEGKYVLSDTGANAPPGGKPLSVKLMGSLVNGEGEVLSKFNSGDIVAGKFTTLVSGEENVIKMLGPNVTLPLTGFTDKRDAKLREALTKPTANIAQQTQVFASAGSPYGLEILVDNKPLKVKSEEGLPFVTLEKTNLYQIRIINNAESEAAADLSIDGLSVFTFSDLRQKDGPKKGQPLYTNYIIPAKSSTILKGWHKTNDKVDSFLVTDYEQSAAAKLGKTSGLGVVTCSFSAAWPKGQNPPRDEPLMMVVGDPATGFGPPVAQRAEEVRRQTGMLRGSVSIRYTCPTGERPQQRPLIYEGSGIRPNLLTFSKS